MSRTLTFFLLLLTLEVFAQTMTVKFGFVEQNDLEMTVYERDTTAEAVVLYDKGNIDIQKAGSGYKFEFTHHRRIKILHKNAFDEGSISIPYYKKERVYYIKAHTISPEGKITPLDEDNIFVENINEYWNAKKFTFPNLQVGSVIEFKYELSSEYVIELKEWYFQGRYPVRYSELNIDAHPYLEYVYLFQGNELKPEDESADGLVEIKDKQFIMRNAPALKEETFITSMDNYRARMRFQLRKSDSPGSLARTFMTTWKEVGEELEHQHKFGNQFRFKRNFNKAWKAVEPLLANAQTEDDKIKIIYEYVQKNIGWNGYIGIFMNEPLDKIIDEGSGNIAAINLLLVGLLNEAGIKAAPLLCSKRSKGYPLEDYPILDQFNYVVAHIDQDGKSLLLDASSQYHPMGYIRVDALNYKGWVVEEKNFRWIPIVPQKASRILWSKLELDNEGRITGGFKGRFSGHTAISERQEYQQTSGEYWNTRLSERFPDMKIEDVQYENITDLDKPFSTSLNFTWQEASQKVGDFMYLSPIIYTSFDENPFKLEKRNYPVEIPYPFKEQIVLNLTIPEAYVVDALPDNVRLTFPNREASFQYLASSEEDMITINARIEINQLVFSSEEYDAIKGLFDSIIETFQEQIVLKKVH